MPGTASLHHEGADMFEATCNLPLWLQATLAGTGAVTLTLIFADRREALTTGAITAGVVLVMGYLEVVPLVCR